MLPKRFFNTILIWNSFYNVVSGHQEQQLAILDPFLIEFWETWICHHMLKEFLLSCSAFFFFFFSLSERQALQRADMQCIQLILKLNALTQILKFVQLLLRDFILLYKTLINSIYLKYLCQLKTNQPFVKVTAAHFLWDITFNFCTHCRRFNMSLL